MTRVTVSVSGSYDVLIGSGLLDSLGARCAAVHAPCKAALVCDSNVAPLYAQRAEQSLAAAGFDSLRFVFPAGEKSKNLETYTALQNFLAENRLSRSDIIVALGGGVTGDLAGFAAATYMRGIDFVQVPTTLLAMVDSSVGGKTAVDLPAGKNLVGAFHQPILVLCDPDTLATLPEEYFRDGCGEVVKYGLMSDAALFDSLAQAPIRSRLEAVIARCVEIKRDVVSVDEFDTGLRRILNLGHTFGHGIEAAANYTVSHGCAVAMGMAIITRAAAKLGCCPDAAVQRLEALLESCGLPTRAPVPAEAIFAAAMGDKKISAGRLHLVVPRDIGRCEILSVAPNEAMDWLKAGGAE